MNTKPLWIMAVVLASASVLHSQDVDGSKEAGKIIAQAKASGAASAAAGTAEPKQTQTEVGPILIIELRMPNTIDATNISVASEKDKATFKRIVDGFLPADWLERKDGQVSKLQRMTSESLPSVNIQTIQENPPGDAVVEALKGRLAVIVRTIRTKE